MGRSLDTEILVQEHYIYELRFVIYFANFQWKAYFSQQGNS